MTLCSSLSSLRPGSRSMTGKLTIVHTWDTWADGTDRNDVVLKSIGSCTFILNTVSTIRCTNMIKNQTLIH